MYWLVSSSWLEVIYMELPDHAIVFQFPHKFHFLFYWNRPEHNVATTVVTKPAAGNKLPGKFLLPGGSPGDRIFTLI